jgi:LacI family transcriptional regulator
MVHRKVDGENLRRTLQATDMKTIYTRIPCVWVFEAGYQPSFELDMVCEDNAFIGAMAARRLYEHGHRKMAVVNLEPDHDSLRVRRMFFVEEAERLGVSVQAFNVNREDAAKAFDKLSGKSNRPTGLFVPGTDSCVMDVYRGLEERDVLIGRDMEMISVNNDTHRLWALNPTLTNIDIHPEHIGQAAVDTLLFRLCNPGAARRRVVISPSFMDNPAAPRRASHVKNSQ